MKDCETRRAEIEADRHGALDAAAAATLAAHLERCVACRAYRDRMDAMERALARGTDRAGRAIDWRGLERRIARSRGRPWGHVAGSVAFIAVTIAAAIVISPWFLILLFYAIDSLHESREVLREDRVERAGLRTTGEWLAYYRQQVRDRFRTAAIPDGLGSLAIAAFLGFLAIVGRYTVPVGIAAGAMFLIGLYSIFFRARRLLREYHAIEPFAEVSGEDPAA